MEDWGMEGKWPPLWQIAQLLSPFCPATVELAKETRVSGSKVNPMAKMFMLYFYDTVGKISHSTARPGVRHDKHVWYYRKPKSWDPVSTTGALWFCSHLHASVKLLTAQYAQLMWCTKTGTLTKEHCSTPAHPSANVENPLSMGHVRSWLMVKW